MTCCAVLLPWLDQPSAPACSVPRQAPAPPTQPLKGSAAKLAQQLLALDPNLFLVRRMHPEATDSHQPANTLGCRSPQSPKQTVSSSASLKRQSRMDELPVRAQLLVLHGCKWHVVVLQAALVLHRCSLVPSQAPDALAQQWSSRTDSLPCSD